MIKIMKCVIFIFCLTMAMIQVFAASMPDSCRKITIAGKRAPSDNSRSSAKLTLFMPDEIKSARLIDAGGQERGLTVLMRHGSQVSVFFDGSPGEELSIEFYREPEERKTAEQISGLLHLVRTFNSDATVNNVEDFRKLWNASGASAGGRHSRPAAPAPGGGDRPIRRRTSSQPSPAPCPCRASAPASSRLP